MGYLLLNILKKLIYKILKTTKKQENIANVVLVFLVFKVFSANISIEMCLTDLELWCS